MSLSKFGQVMQQMRTFLWRGALFLLPIAVTIFIARFSFSLVDSYLGGATAALVRLIIPHWLLGPFPDGHIPGLSMVLLVFVLIVLGAIASWKVGSQGLRIIDYVALKIPVIGPIYASTRKFVDSIGNADRFQRVVFLKIFGENLRGLAFVTGETVDTVSRIKTLWVFYPHIPNPTSGVLLNVLEKDTVPIDVPPQECFKWLMSLGTLMPAEMPLFLKQPDQATQEQNVQPARAEGSDQPGEKTL